MNRTGFFIAVFLAVAAAIVFAVFPELDLVVARFFYDEMSRRFPASAGGFAQFCRRSAMWIAWGFAAPAMLALIGKIIWPERPMFMRGRTAIFLVTTILMTAVVLPNLVFKEYWGRPRPVATKVFGGPHDFRPWWDPRGTNPHNGSFFSGEAATAFWTFAPASLAPAPVRPLAYLGVIIFGLTTGILRIAFGGHYVSDIVAAGLAAYFVVWLGYRLIYSSSQSCWKNEVVEDGLARFGRALRSTALGRLSLIIGAITVFRLIALHFSVVDLFPDEARYWAWAQSLSFGYFSKPPLIAWLIAAVTHFCGNGEGCVRAAAPLLYAGTSLVSFFIGRRLYDERAAFWAGLCLIFATGLIYSARIITTDVPLLFCWALALLAWIRLREGPSLKWTIVLGSALGFGVLAKYAMLYFVLSMLVAAWLDAPSRKIWRRGQFWLALLLAFIIVAPNIAWNASHQFATFRHTQGNIVGGGFKFSPLRGFAFLGSQFGVIGPVLFAAFLLALVRPSRFTLQASDRVLLVFAVPLLLLVTLAAFITDVEGNWAAPAAVSVVVFSAALLVRQNQRRWLLVSVTLGLVLQLLLVIGDAKADRVSLPFLAKPDIYHRTMGWKAISELVRQSAIENYAQTIAAEDKDLLPELLYYLRGSNWTIRAAPPGSVPANQFELDRPLTSTDAAPILYLAGRPWPSRVEAACATIQSVSPIIAPTGPHSTRSTFAFKLSECSGLVTAPKPASR